MVSFATERMLEAVSPAQLEAIEEEEDDDWLVAVSALLLRARAKMSC